VLLLAVAASATTVRVAAGLAVAAGVAGSALGQTSAPPDAARMVPNVAGKGSKLVVDVEPPASGGSESPSAAVMAIARGFRFDRRARKRRCTEQQARDFDCTVESRIGRGSAEIEARGLLVPDGRQTFTASIQIFLAAPFQRGDLAGIVFQASEPRTGTRRSSNGRLVRVAGGGPFGTELRLEGLPTPPSPPPGVTVELKRVEFRVGAGRTIRRRRTVRRRVRTRRGVRIRRRRVTRRIRRHLIRNPRRCRGSWPYELRLAFPSGDRTYAGELTCRKARRRTRRRR
jgi:hypothetical protein